MNQSTCSQLQRRGPYEAFMTLNEQVWLCSLHRNSQQHNELTKETKNGNFSPTLDNPTTVYNSPRFSTSELLWFKSNQSSTNWTVPVKELKCVSGSHKAIPASSKIHIILKTRSKLWSCRFVSIIPWIFWSAVALRITVFHGYWVEAQNISLLVEPWWFGAE